MAGAAALRVEAAHTPPMNASPPRVDGPPTTLARIRSILGTSPSILGVSSILGSRTSPKAKNKLSHTRGSTRDPAEWNWNYSLRRLASNRQAVGLQLTAVGCNRRRTPKGPLRDDA